MNQTDTLKNEIRSAVQTHTHDRQTLHNKLHKIRSTHGTKETTAAIREAITETHQESEAASEQAKQARAELLLHQANIGIFEGLTEVVNEGDETVTYEHLKRIVDTVRSDYGNTAVLRAVKDNFDSYGSVPVAIESETDTIGLATAVCQIVFSSPEFDPSPYSYAPTGTYADALEMRDVLLARIDRDTTQAARSAMRWLDDHASLVYIDRDIIGHIVESAQDIPQPDSIEDLKLARNGLVVCGAPVICTEMPQPGVAVGMVWSADWDSTEPNLVVGVITADEDRVILYEQVVELNETGWTFWLRFIAAMSAWMESVAEVDEQHAPRAARKRSQREGNRPREITTVKLRKLESKPWTPKLGADGLPTREYTHRWIVRGHWRMQACGPARTRRRPTWIAPHIAGPPDKPLMNKTRVVKVDR